MRHFNTIPISARIGMTGIALVVFCALFAPWIAPKEPNVIVGQVWESMQESTFLGTDSLGRDLLSRLIYGARTTFFVALAATCLSFLLGISSSLMAVASGGMVDTGLSRFNDLMMSVPALILALIILAVLPQNIWVLIGVMAAIDATRVYRVGRAAALDASLLDFVEVARLRGESKIWIICREILPQTFAPLLGEFGLRFAYAILFLSTLSFLGLGIQPPVADWGGMVKDNKDGIIFGVSAALLPGAAIAFLVICVNLVVDWLIDESTNLKGGIKNDPISIDKTDKQPT